MRHRSTNFSFLNVAIYLLSKKLYSVQLAGQVPPTLPNRGAVPKQSPQQLQKTPSKTEVAHSPVSLPVRKPAASGVDVLLSMPSHPTQSFDVIKENQELRYRYFIWLHLFSFCCNWLSHHFFRTQELMNKGYGLYRNVLGLDFEGVLSTAEQKKTTDL